MHLYTQICLAGLVLLASHFPSSFASSGVREPGRWLNRLNSESDMTNASPSSLLSKPNSSFMCYRVVCSLLEPHPACSPFLPPSFLEFQGREVTPEHLLDMDRTVRKISAFIGTCASFNKNPSLKAASSLLEDVNTLEALAAHLPKALVLHGTLNYNEPQGAYNMAKEATSSLTITLRLVKKRLDPFQPEKGTGPLTLDPEELSQIPRCREKNTLYTCLRELYNDFVGGISHFSHPTSPELYDPILNTSRVKWEALSRTCPAWLTLTPPWALVPSALYVLPLLPNGASDPFSRVLMDWIMCIMIGHSKVTRTLSPSFTKPMREALYLLEDKMLEKIMAQKPRETESSSQDILYEEFKQVLEYDNRIRYKQRDRETDGDRPNTSETAPSSYSYALLKRFMPYRLRSSYSTSSTLGISQSQVSLQMQEDIQSDLVGSKPIGKDLMEVMFTWIKEHPNGIKNRVIILSRNDKPRSCEKLLGNLITTSIKSIVKQKPHRKTMEKKVRDYLARLPHEGRTVSPGAFGMGKVPLIEASLSVYDSLMDTLLKEKVRPSPGLSHCIQALLASIYLSHSPHQGQ
ncbi:MAG: hypothetical protein DHS80DRAFT_26344 [Piptocephalis tieghemiana]|nr:MAG: hypothetical protein DHS80DRAFT_26344 [Piptocephalis tieghemiana]